jgi:DNA-binding IscR family transcriptional regulator
VLAHDPKDISLAEIIEVLEGPLDIADCADVPSCCLDSNACALKDIFTRANKALYKVFAEVSLAQLAEEQMERENSQVLMYHI